MQSSLESTTTQKQQLTRNFTPTDSLTKRKAKRMWVEPDLSDNSAKKIPTCLTSKRQAREIVKHAQTIHRMLPTNCLSVFDYFVGLTFKKLKKCYQTAKLQVIFN